MATVFRRVACKAICHEQPSSLLLEPDIPMYVRALAGRPILSWWTLFCGVVTLLAFVFAGVMTFQYGMSSRELGWKGVGPHGAWVVGEVDPGSVADGRLQRGDRIKALNDDPRFDLAGPALAALAFPIGEPYTVTVERAGTLHRVELAVSLVRDGRNLFHTLSSLLVGLVFFAVAILIGISRSAERIPCLASQALTVTALVFVRRALEPMVGFIHGIELLPYMVILASYPFHLPTAYHFFHLFPAGRPPGRLWSLLNGLLYAGAALVWWRHVGQAAVMLSEETWASALLSPPSFLPLLIRNASHLHDAYVPLGLLFISGVILRNYQVLTEPDMRRRIRWMGLGTIAGVMPIIMVTLWGFTYNYLFGVARNTHTPLLSITRLSPVLIPLSVGYAVLKHRVMDIHLYIRLGIQYLLARNVLKLILYLPLIALGYAILFRRDRTLDQLLLEEPAYLIMIAAAAVSLRYRTQVSRWLDRRFFREAYDQELILASLLERVKELESISELSREVVRELERAMHLRSIYVFFREDGHRDLTLDVASDGTADTIRLSLHHPLFQLLEDRREALNLPLDPPALAPGCEWLEKLGARLLVPMNDSNHALVGMLVLGEKRSEEPFSSVDRKLLNGLAAQLAMAYENLWLKRRMQQEQKLKLEVLGRMHDQNIQLLRECPVCGTCVDSDVRHCPHDGTEVTLPLPVERTLEQRYRLEKRIGVGGMGAVYEARDLRLNRRVAVKLMLGRLSSDPGARRRFEREARATARLNHPNLVPIYDYGAISSDGAYLVMELVQGETLRAVLTKAGRLAPARVAEWLEQVLEGIAAAHASGIIHRDLKPENVLVVPGPEGRSLARVLDFGIARTKGVDMLDSSTVSMPGAILGTLGYMSPEQLNGREVDERTDIFSLGVMVIEALTGERPFRGGSYIEHLMALCSAPYHLPGQSAEEQTLDAALQRCIAHEPEGRFRSVAELKQGLLPALHACPSVEGGIPKTERRVEPETLVTGENGKGG